MNQFRIAAAVTGIVILTAGAALTQQKPASGAARGSVKKTSPAAADEKVKSAVKAKTDAAEKKNSGSTAEQSPGEKKGSAEEKDKPDAKAAELEAKKAAELQEKENKRAESLENILKFGLQSERRDAVKRVLTIKDKALRAKLAAVLHEIVKTDDEPEVIARAINTLGELGYTAAAEAIAKHIDNSNEDVAIAAVYCLKKLNAEPSKTALAEKLKKQNLTADSNFTEALIVTLGDFKSDEVYQTAEDAIKNPKTTKNFREQFIIYLGKLGSPKPKELLLKLYKDPDEDMTIRSYAVNALAKLGLKEVIPEIRAVLKEIDSFNYKKKKKYNSLQIYSIAALAKLGDTEVVPLLIAQLKSDNPGVRLKAISLLKELGDKSSIDILKYRMKNDPDAKVRKAAKGALKAIGVDTGDDSETEDTDETDGEKEGADESPQETKKKDKK